MKQRMVIGSIGAVIAALLLASADIAAQFGGSAGSRSYSVPGNSVACARE